MRVPSKQLFPDVMYVTMKYCEAINDSSAITNSGVYQFRGNSIFDPNFTGVGHQPLGHDTYEQLYRRYTVLGSSITVHFINTDADPVTVAVAPKYNSVAGSVIEQLIEDENGRSLTVSATGSDDSGVLRSPYIASRDILGAAEAESVSTFFGSNPTVPWYWGIIYTNLNGGGTGFDVKFRVVINYYVQLDGKTSMALS